MTGRLDHPGRGSWIGALVLVLAACSGSGGPGPALDVPADPGTLADIDEVAPADLPVDEARRADPGMDLPAADEGDDTAPPDAAADVVQGGDDAPPIADVPDAPEEVDVPPEPLSLESVLPTRGGATVGTAVVIRGHGFVQGMTATLGGAAVQSLVVTSSREATAVFGPVALTDRGTKDLEVVVEDHGASLKDAFTFDFDQDPIVFVHGFMGGGEKDFGVMLGRFRDLGYPDDYLNAITYQDDTGENIPQARDELAPYVDAVLAKTGASKVDLVVHSMGGLSSRLYIRQFGGADKVRDYVSTCGAHHGTEGGCATLWWAGARDMCPAYAGKGNEVQWTLNGDPDTDDVDETPGGVEDGGGIYWHAMYSDGDLIILPYTGSCLNQKSRNDCSDPVNVALHGLSHNDVPKNEGVFKQIAEWVMAHTPANP